MLYCSQYAVSLQVKPVFKKDLIPRESDYLHYQIVSQKIAKL